MKKHKLIFILIIISIIFSGCVSLTQTNENAEISRIVDGDTVEISSGEKIRLIGVDTPEKFGEVNTEEFESVENKTCLKEYAYKATKFMEENLEDKKVNMSTDYLVGDKGSYGRKLRYIEHNGTDYNKRLVEQGLARVYTEKSSIRMDSYLEEEKQARKNKKGLWSCN